eukprot:3066263-Prymnesium_polylepis.2
MAPYCAILIFRDLLRSLSDLYDIAKNSIRVRVGGAFGRGPRARAGPRPRVPRVCPRASYDIPFQRSTSPHSGHPHIHTTRTVADARSHPETNQRESLSCKMQNPETRRAPFAVS